MLVGAGKSMMCCAMHASASGGHISLKTLNNDTQPASEINHSCQELKHFINSVQRGLDWLDYSPYSQCYIQCDAIFQAWTRRRTAFRVDLR